MSVTVDTDEDISISGYESEDAISDIEDFDEEINEYDVGNDETTYKDKMYIYVLNNIKSFKYKPTEYLKYNQDITIYQPSFVYSYVPVNQFTILNKISSDKREEVSSKLYRAKSLFVQKDVKSIISSETTLSSVVIKTISTIDKNIKVPTEDEIVKYFTL